MGSEDSAEKELSQLQGTVRQYRNWIDELFSKYSAQYPEAVQSTKRLYIGNLPANINEDELSKWLVSVMEECGLKYDMQNTYPITSCRITYTNQRGGDDDGGASVMYIPPSINREQQPTTGESSSKPSATPDAQYAFLQFRNPEDASNFMGLDGIEYKGRHLKMRRPSNYDPNTAVMIGPTEPNPALDFSKMNIIKTFVADSPHKLFIGGLPYEYDEEKVKELLLPFGKLEAFYLAVDKYTGNSRGYAFCEYIDKELTDQVIRALNGQFLRGKVLTVKRAVV